MSLQDNAFCSYRDSTLSPNDVLMLYNRAAKRIQYHDLGTGQQLRTIQLQTEGPDGVGEGRLAPSNRAVPFAPMKKPNTDFNEEYLHFMQQTAYPAILYDPYREVYYRFVYHPMAGPHTSKILNQDFKIAYSIMVLDKEFRVISEQLLDKYGIVPRAFVGKRGLYIEGAYYKWLEEKKYRYTEDTMLLMCLTLKPGLANE